MKVNKLQFIVTKPQLISYDIVLCQDICLHLEHVIQTLSVRIMENLTLPYSSPGSCFRHISRHLRFNKIKRRRKVRLFTHTFTSLHLMY
jgi:hypothetical protein